MEESITEIFSFMIVEKHTATLSHSIDNGSAEKWNLSIGYLFFKLSIDTEIPQIKKEFRTQSKLSSLKYVSHIKRKELFFP